MRHWIDHHPDHPVPNKDGTGGTAAKYGVTIEGAKDPVRQKLHDEIISKHFDHVEPVAHGYTPVAIVTMGGPASGKSTALEKLGFAGRDNFVQVDPDAIKTGEKHLDTPGLPEYHQAVNMGYLADGTPVSAKSGAAVVHQESSFIADKLREKAIAAKKHLIIDGTGKNAANHIALVQHLKSQGYHVHLVMPHQTVENADKLNHARAIGEGRYVPDDIVHSAYAQIPHNFEAVAKHADTADLFDATKGFPPKHMWSKRGPKQESVKDPQAWRAFRSAHGPEKIQKSQREGAALTLRPRGVYIDTVRRTPWARKR